MSAVELTLLVAWGVCAAVPLAWWWRHGRHLDVWNGLPLPAAIVDAAGRVRERTGPPATFLPPVSAPPRGTILRAQAADGTELAIGGLARGSLVLALPPDPARARRDALLSELAPRLAHEVATPLEGLIGNLEVLSGETFGSEAQRSLEHCRRELRRLVGLSRDLLTLTGLRAGTSPLTREDAGELVEEVVAGLLGVADSLGVQLVSATPPQGCPIHVARRELLIALRNLADNALRHGVASFRAAAGGRTGGATGARPALADGRGPGPATDAPSGVCPGPAIAALPSPAAPVVSVQALHTRAGVMLRVVDPGGGIAPGELAALCEPLAHGPGPGSGIGLAIAREVVAAHGSRLECGRLSGGGSWVGFTLPSRLAG